MNNLEIHDIKGLTQIPDISFYIFLGLCALGITLLLILIFLLYKYFNNRKKNKRKEYYKILKELDLSNSKQAAYTISKYARLLVSSDRERKICAELIEELEAFKYKKDVEEINDEVKIIFGRFMDIIDV